MATISPITTATTVSPTAVPTTPFATAAGVPATSVAPFGSVATTPGTLSTAAAGLTPTTATGGTTLPTAAPEVGGTVGPSGTSLGTPGSTLASGTGVTANALTGSTLSATGLAVGPTSAGLTGTSLGTGVGTLGTQPTTTLTTPTTTVSTPITTTALPVTPETTAQAIGGTTGATQVIPGEPLGTFATALPTATGVTSATTSTPASPSAESTALASSATPASPAAPAATPGPQTFEASLVPLNNSNVHGSAIVSVAGPMVTVDITASGLQPGQTHMQSISTMANGTPDSVPTAANDVDHDGFIEQAEAAQTLGQPALSLSTDPQISLPAMSSPLAGALTTFPQADAAGMLHYHQVFTANPAQPTTSAALANVVGHLSGAAVLLQGLTVPPGPGAGTPGEVNGTNGYLPQLPVAVGLLHEVPPGEAPMLG